MIPANTDLLDELKTIIKTAHDAQVEAYYKREQELQQRIAEDKANFMAIVYKHYEEIVTKLREQAAKGSDYYFGHWSVRKEYWDTVLGPAMQLIKKRFLADGFHITRFDYYDSYYISEAGGRIPKRHLVSLDIHMEVR